MASHLCASNFLKYDYELIKDIIVSHSYLPILRAVQGLHPTSVHNYVDVDILDVDGFENQGRRLVDPTASLPFYEKNFGMKVTDIVKTSTESRYFLVRPKNSELDSYDDEPGSVEARAKLYARDCNYIELIHKHGSESDSSVKYDSGNVEPTRGFGHLCFAVADVYAASEKLDAAGVSFKKKPDEGRMKGLAFVLDPDGYWIELVKRSENGSFDEEYNLAQTMIRIKDPAKSLAFYLGHLGMRMMFARHFSDFSLFFLMTVPDECPAVPSSEADRSNYVKSAWRPILELTHNHGTEKDPDFKHHNGNSAPLGFCNIGFTTTNLEDTCKKMRHDGIIFADASLAQEVGVSDKVKVVLDPDGYAVKLIERGAVI